MNGEKEEEEEAKGVRARGGRRAPPAYAELSPHFSFLEKAAAESGNGEATLSLAKIRMATIAAHSAKPARQADLRGREEGGGASK